MLTSFPCLRQSSRLKQIQLTLVHGESLRSLHKLGFQRIHADSGRLAQVIINLLSNAIRFTTPAPVRKICVTIEVRKNPPDDDTCIPPPPSPRLVPTATDAGDESDCYIYGSVADSGPGLSPEELARLFQRFKQASAQTHVGESRHVHSRLRSHADQLSLLPQSLAAAVSVFTSVAKSAT